MDNARIGDVTQLYRNGNWSHSIILTARTSAGWLFCGHSTSRKDYPYNKAYADGGYTNARAIKLWY